MIQPWTLTVLSCQISYSFKQGHTVVAEMLFNNLGSEQADLQSACVSALLANPPGAMEAFCDPCFSPSNAMCSVILFKCIGKIRKINTVLTNSGLSLILGRLFLPFQMRKLEGIRSVLEII